MIDSYVTCVATELDAMIQIYNKHIIPRCIDQQNKIKIMLHQKDSKGISVNLKPPLINFSKPKSN